MIHGHLQLKPWQVTIAANAALQLIRGTEQLTEHMIAVPDMCGHIVV
jgi:hypothetical protein